MPDALGPLSLPMSGRSPLRQGAIGLLRLVGAAADGSAARDIDVRQFKRLLFLQFCQPLGAAVNATPIFEGMKRALPDCHISVACANAARAVLQNNPYIDRLIPIPDPHTRLAAAAWRLRRAIADGPRYDCVVTSCGNAKSRLALLGWLSHARYRVGFTSVPRFYHIALARDPGLSFLRNNLRLPELFGFRNAALEPCVYFTEADRDAARRLLAAPELAGTKATAVFITQTSGGQPTRWYDDRFAAVADRLHERHGTGIVFVGTAQQSAAIDALRRLMKRPSVNLAGRTGIAELAALICQSDIAVSLDTGSMHLTRATGVPFIVIAPGWQPPHEWLPLGVPHCRILRRNDVSCLGCAKPVDATHECMDRISAADVSEAADELLRLYPPSARDRERRVDRSLSPRRPIG